MTEAKNGLGQRNRKSSMDELFLYNSLVVSKRSAEATTHIVDDTIKMVKTSTRRFFVECLIVNVVE